MGWGWRALLAVGAAAVPLLGCGSDDDVACVSTEVGEVCAERSDGAIVFRGSGLAPGSDVTIEHPELGPMNRVAGADGRFDSDAQGVLSLVADTEFIFEVTATDANGAPVTGQLAIRS